MRRRERSETKAPGTMFNRNQRGFWPQTEPASQPTTLPPQRPFRNDSGRLRNSNDDYNDDDDDNDDDDHETETQSLGLCRKDFGKHLPSIPRIIVLVLPPSLPFSISLYLRYNRNPLLLILLTNSKSTLWLFNKTSKPPFLPLPVSGNIEQFPSASKATDIRLIIH